MKTESIIKIKPTEGRYYIIGRSGHIYIDDATISKQHAVIHVLGKKIYLRDLESTNGTYLIVNKKLIPFTEGYVQLHQSIVLGSRQYTVYELLKIVGSFESTADRSSLTTVTLNQTTNQFKYTPDQFSEVS